MPLLPVSVNVAAPTVTSSVRPLRLRILTRSLTVPVHGPNAGHRMPTCAEPLRTVAVLEPSVAGPATTTPRLVDAERFCESVTLASTVPLRPASLALGLNVQV